MVRVYFETDGYAELVAIFDSEATYDACYEALEKQAKDNNFLYVTESVDSEDNYEVVLIDDNLEETKIFGFSSYDETLEVASSFSLKYPTLNIQIKKA